MKFKVGDRIRHNIYPKSQGTVRDIGTKPNKYCIEENGRSEWFDQYLVELHCELVNVAAMGHGPGASQNASNPTHISPKSCIACSGLNLVYLSEDSYTAVYQCVDCQVANIVPITVVTKLKATSYGELLKAQASAVNMKCESEANEQAARRCECGSDSIGGGSHATYCPKHV